MTPVLSRRDWLKLSAAGVVSYSLSHWLEGLADAAAAHPARKRAVILLWMNGGPSQLETFDCKPAHKNGGGAREIATSVPGIQISENLPRPAKLMKHLALVRKAGCDSAQGWLLGCPMPAEEVPGWVRQVQAAGGDVCRLATQRDPSPGQGGVACGNVASGNRASG